MRNLKHLFMLCLFGMISIGAFSQDFTIINDGWQYRFVITSSADLTCELYSAFALATETPNPSSIANIPTSVTYNNKTYSVTSIGYGVFRGDIVLESVTIPNTIISIKESAFYSCSSLTSIYIPSSVKSIGEEAFCYCPNLETIDVDEYNTIYDSRQDCNAIIETASNTLIAGCKNSVIPNDVQSIGNWAFGYCSELTSIKIPNGIVAIGEGAFADTGLLSISIPQSVNSIGWLAFAGCPFTDVYVHWETLPLNIHSKSFVSYASSVTNVTLHVPVNTKDLYKTADVWKDFGTIVENVENPNITIIRSNNSCYEAAIVANDELSLEDDIKSIEVAEQVKDVCVTYTRNFEKSGVWQAWYMPFDVAFDDMKDAYDVAQIHGVLLDKDNNAVLAFLKLDDGTVKANTPYVVRPKASGDVAIETTTDLQPTVSKSFDLKSATDIYYLGGVYEKTTTPGNWYALNLDGQFQLMDTGVYLRPFRIYMTIDPRDDNPYATSVNANAKMDIVVLGDDGEATGINLTPALSQGEGVIYNLNGQRVTSITSGQIYIMNGKKYIAK